MMLEFVNRKCLFLGAMSLVGVVGCAATPPPPPPPAVVPYSPNFSYKADASDKKLDVTLGIIDPEYKPGSAMYHQTNMNDETFMAMLRAMDASFNEILIAKGFNTKGPFTSINEMTYPEKMGSDLLLYPVFDFEVLRKASNLRHAAPATNTTSLGNILNLPNLPNIPITTGSPAKGAAENAGPSVCDITISVAGNVQFVAYEPVTDQRMWQKQIKFDQAAETIQGQTGDVCKGGEMTTEVRNAWAKAHEIVFQTSMKALEHYVNGQEFQGIKATTVPLRAKKAY